MRVPLTLVRGQREAVWGLELGSFCSATHGAELQVGVVIALRVGTSLPQTAFRGAMVAKPEGHAALVFREEAGGWHG